MDRSDGSGWRGPGRHQLPVLSPVSSGALLKAASGRVARDARERLHALLCREYDASTVVLCGSGTQALQLAIAESLARVERGATVALPAFACFDVASAAIGAGGPVQFYDVDPSTLSPDLASLEAALRGGAKVVVIAPLYGIPVDWERITALCDAHGAIPIEDAAQGQGARWDGRRLGSLGQVSVLSFGRGKGWTGGGGGALLLRGGASDGLDSTALAPAPPRSDLRTLVALAGQWAIGRPRVYGLPASLPFLHLGETVYHPPRLPSGMASMAVALALDHHALAEAAAERRRITGGEWQERLAALEGIRVPEWPERADPGFLRFPVRIDGGMAAFADRGEAVRLGVAASYPIVLPSLPEIQSARGERGGEWPGAGELVRSLVTLPTHGSVSLRDVLRLMTLLRGLQRA